MAEPTTKAGATIGLRLAEQVFSGAVLSEVQLRTARAGVAGTFVVLSQPELAALIGMGVEEGMNKVLAGRDPRPPLKFKAGEARMERELAEHKVPKLEPDPKGQR